MRNNALLVFFFTMLFINDVNADNILADFKERSAENGYQWEIVYIGEYWANTKGGIKRDSSYLSNLDVALSVDTQKAGFWNNGTFFVYGLLNHDTGKTADYTGALQVISNIEATRSVRLYELWYEHRFNEDKVAILLGQHDYNSEFFVTEYGGLFINSSFGIGPNVSVNGRPSVFPVAAPAARLKVKPKEQWEYLIGVYDGNPGAADVNRHGTRWILSADQGAFLASEIIFHEKNENYPGTYKIGVWHNTGEFDDLVDTDDNGDPVNRDGNLGAYLVIDKMIYREAEDQGLALFLQAGGAPDYINQVDLYLGGGLNYKGLIAGRDQDQTGIAVAYASISDKLVSTGANSRAETILELTHRIFCNEHFIVQPDLQIIFDPGADPNIDTAVVTGVRFELSI